MITSCNRLNCSYRYLFSRIPLTEIKQGSFSDSKQIGLFFFLIVTLFLVIQNNANILFDKIDFLYLKP